MMQRPQPVSPDFEEDPLSHESLITDGFNIKGTVFVIPVDAPLPNELTSLDVPTGVLYRRLRYLAEPFDTDFAFVAVSGSELLALDRSWKLLTEAKSVAVLLGLPGARYDVVFDQARKQLGLKPLDWLQVSDTIANRVRLTQRVTDKEPWLLTKPKLPKYEGANAPLTEQLPIPEPDQE